MCHFIAHHCPNRHLELARIPLSSHRDHVFKPLWKKEALLLQKSAQKFLNYKRDLLEEDQINEVKSRQSDLTKAIKAKDEKSVKEASKQLHNTCNRSLKQYASPGWLEENIEVFWVAIVVALGIRAYFLQPFRIPTGSMQPSLNGIILEDKSAEDPNWKKPWIAKRAFDYLFSGKSYSDVKAEKDLSIVGIRDSSWFLFSRSRVSFSDGSSITISSPPQEVSRLSTIAPHVIGQLPSGQFKFRPGIHYKTGHPIFVGERITGDLVLVDKFSYHFRNPKRGESFVFDTMGIPTDPGGGDQSGGTHYIKRLAGLPGDKIQVQEPYLHINDAIAQEETFARVSSKEDGYGGYTNPDIRTRSPFSNPNYSLTLSTADDPNYNEYFAMGDNSANSSDSRMWGTVKQYNLMGPAFIALWPFGSGHWGLIK